MKDKDFDKWAITRRQGILPYILKFGVIAWGVPMFITMSFIVNKPFANGFTIKNIAVHGGIWLCAGIFFGLATWLVFEKMYQKRLASRQRS